MGKSGCKVDEESFEEICTREVCVHFVIVKTKQIKEIYPLEITFTSLLIADVIGIG